MSASAATSVDRALWPLALLAGLLPLVATAIAYLLSIRMGLVPECNPFFEGCVSISRAARHDLPNILFRALLLPAAVLQAMCWLLCPGWLRTLGAAPSRWLRALPGWAWQRACSSCSTARSSAPRAQGTVGCVATAWCSTSA
jgi:hypothetical protein